MSGFSQYIIGRATRLIAHPVYNFTSIAVILCSIILLAIPSIANLSLQQSELIWQLDLILLGIMALEIILRLFSIQNFRYIRSLALPIDLLTVLPLPVWGIALLLMNYNLIDPELVINMHLLPGMLLFKGVRSLRLLNSVRYFHRHRQLGLIDPESISPLKSRFFTGMASLAFIMVLIIGIGIAIQLHHFLEEGRTSRRQQVSMQARSYGALQAKLVFGDVIPGVFITRGGRRQYVPGTVADRSRLKTTFALHRDYEQIDEINPGESVLISYRDLSRSQHQIELLILAVGIFVIGTMLFSLNRLIDQMILKPVERATKVADLRIAGEELETSDIQQEPYTEVVRLINMNDRIYQKLRAPARTLLTNDAGLTNPPPPDESFSPGEPQEDPFSDTAPESLLS